MRQPLYAPPHFFQCAVQCIDTYAQVPPSEHPGPLPSSPVLVPVSASDTTNVGAASVGVEGVGVGGEIVGSDGVGVVDGGAEGGPIGAKVPSPGLYKAGNGPPLPQT